MTTAHLCASCGKQVPAYVIAMSNGKTFTVDTYRQFITNDWFVCVTGPQEGFWCGPCVRQERDSG